MAYARDMEQIIDPCVDCGKMVDVNVEGYICKSCREKDESITSLVFPALMGAVFIMLFILLVTSA